MSSNKKAKPVKAPKKVNTQRRSQLEYFGKAAAVIAGMSMLPSLTSGAVNFRKASGAQTLFLADNGNVGVGTITPSAKLDVRGSSAVNAYNVPDGSEDLRVLSSNNRPDDGGILTIGGSSGVTGFIKTAAKNNSAGDLIIGNRRLVTDTTMTAGIVLTTAGNVLIGKTTATNTGTGNIEVSGKVYGAVWNDIADYLETENDVNVEFGKVYVLDKKGKTRVSQKRCEQGVVGIASDTYGMSVGKKGKGKKEIPIALAGIVLAHVDKAYASGTPLVCTKAGKLTKARFFDRSYKIIATYYKSEKSKKWNGIIVGDRHLVKIA